MKKIGIVGSRNRDDSGTYELIKTELFREYEDGDWIVSGGAKKGGDRIARTLSMIFGIPILEFNARWDHTWNPLLEQMEYTKYNKTAGFIRNKPIAHHSDILIATPHPSTTEFFKHMHGSVLVKELTPLKGGTENTIEHWIRHKNIYSDGSGVLKWDEDKLILL